MTPLKWFAGGSERSCEAMTIIDHLLEDIKAAPQLTPLKNQLVIYKKLLLIIEQLNKRLPVILFSCSRHIRVIS